MKTLLSACVLATLFFLFNVAAAEDTRLETEIAPLQKKLSSEAELAKLLKKMTPTAVDMKEVAERQKRIDRWEYVMRRLLPNECELCKTGSRDLRRPVICGHGSKFRSYAEEMVDREDAKAWEEELAELRIAKKRDKSEGTFDAVPGGTILDDTNPFRQFYSSGN